MDSEEIQIPSETAGHKCQNSSVSRVLNQCFQLDRVILSFMDPKTGSSF